MSSIRANSSLIAEREIRQRIITGKIPAATWLRESALSECLGISRTPIREACNRLARDGLLDWMPRRGFRSRRLDPAELDAVYPVLVALELLAIDSMAEPLDHLLAELRSLDLRTVDRGESTLRPYEVDYRWHRAVIAGTRNAVLLETHDRLTERIARYLYAYWNRRADFEESATEHDQIIDALARNERDLASALLRSHRSRGKERIHRLMRR